MATLLLPLAVKGAGAALTTGGLSAGALAATSVTLTPLASFITTALGAYIDSAFLMPRLFGRDATEGQRIGDIQLQETVEGAPENRVFGPKNRIAGAVVWMSDLREVRKEEGGKNGEFLTYQYYAHVLIRCCRARVPISRIPKMWADGKVFYDLAAADLTATNNAISGTFVQIIAQFTGLVIDQYLDITSDINGGGTDLSVFKAGNKVVVSGVTGGSTFTNLRLIASVTQNSQTIPLRAITSSVALQVDDVIEIEGTDQTFSVASGVTVTTTGQTNVAVKTKALRFIQGSSITVYPVSVKRGAQANNGTFDAISVTKDPDPSGTQLTVIRIKDGKNPVRLFTNFATGASITIRQSNPTFSRSQVAAIHVLAGGPDQAPHQILQQFEGAQVSQVYGMRNRAGVLLEDLCLTDFGNRLPNFEELVEERSSPAPIGEIIQTVLVDDAGLPASSIDVSGVSGTCEGFSIRGPQPPKRSLQPLFVAYGLVAWERGGVIRFANLSSLTPTTIPVGELGAYGPEESDPAGRPIAVSDPPRDGLPSEVVVSYKSAAKDYQTVTKRGPRTEDVPINIQQIELGGLVLDDNAGQRLADQLIARAWGAQRAISVRLPPSRAGEVHEGMLLTYGPVYGQTWTQFVERLDRGSGLLLKADGPEHDPELLVQTQTSEGTLGFTASSGPQSAPSPATLAILDIPSLEDAHRNTAGFYVAGMSSDPTREWRGAALYWSTDGNNWQHVTDLTTEAVLGYVVNPPTVAVLPGLWDEANTIRIAIQHPTAQLQSCTEEECLLGRNRFLVKGEIIGARTVSFISYDERTREKVYDLSGLLRGLQDTDHEMGAHVANEQVVWLDGPGIKFVPIDFADVDETKAWRLVPNGGFLEDAPAVSGEVAARNARPYKVGDVQGTRDGSDNLTIAWERSTRAIRVFLDQGEPLDEEVEKYEIDVLDGATVVRTISVTEARTAAYSAANQTADGLTPGDPVTVRIYQLSAALLRGQEVEATV